LSLATEASLAAIGDAGLVPGDVDGIVRCDIDVVNHYDLAQALGLRQLTYFGASGSGGAAPCGMVGQAVGAILSGQASTIVAFRSLNGRSGKRFGGRLGVADSVGGNGTVDEMFVPYGCLAPGHAFSLIAQRHMIDYGTTAEHLGHIALACRARANANPAAQMHDRTLTMEQYLSARTISSPLRLYDYCLETDGACAVVISSTERARDCAKPPALIKAVAQSGTPDPHLGGMVFPTVLRGDPTTWPSRDAAATLYARAGIGPADVKVAQLYDCFTITILIQLEDYGFCDKGEGGPFAASGAIDLGGTVPINTAGGHLSEGYINGMNHVLEGVRQVRGESTSQVPDADVCLVSSGVPSSTAAVLLGRA
jgi:acetyl-CoA acetyltransferase